MPTSLPARALYAKLATDPDDAWDLVDHPLRMPVGLEMDFCYLEPSAITRQMWPSTAEQELARIREVYDTTGGALFVADDANQFEDSAGNIAASVNGVMGCWLDSSQSGTVQGRRNLLTYSEDFRNTAAAGETRPWVYYAIGTGTVPVISASAELSPVGPCMRLQANRGAGTTTSDQSVLQHGVAGLVSPINSAHSIYAKSNTGANQSVYFRGSTGLGGSVIIVTTEWKRFYVAETLAATSTQIQIGTRGAVNADAAVDILISCAQLELGTEPTPYQKIITGTADLVPGAHAYQNVTANKPYKRRTPTTGLNWADSNTATAALNVTFNTALGSACTVARVGPDGVEFTENVTIGTSYNIAPAYGWNGDVAIIDRPLTATEKALFTRYMLRHKPGLGAELVVNGTFDTDTSGWTSYSGGATLAGIDGSVEVTAPGGTSYPAIASPVVINTGVQYAFSVESWRGTVATTTNLIFFPATPTINVGLTSNAIRTKSRISFVSGTGRSIVLGHRSAAAPAGTVYFDNVSLKEIL